MHVMQLEICRVRTLNPAKRQSNLNMSKLRSLVFLQLICYKFICIRMSWLTTTSKASYCIKLHLHCTGIRYYMGIAWFSNKQITSIQTWQIFIRALLVMLLSSLSMIFLKKISFLLVILHFISFSPESQCMMALGVEGCSFLMNLAWKFWRSEI